MRNDTSLPLDPARIYYWQHDEQPWQACTGAELANLLDGPRPPAFRTILSLDRPYVEGEQAAYCGPFYIDLDNASISDAIRDANTTLDKLADWGVDLGSVRIFLTGGRGLHVEVPASIFGGTASPYLPAIYHRIAEALATESTDLRVYSARRGRMWRVPNLQRSNGAYKVPVLAEEVRSLTPESFREWCSQPREVSPLAPPTPAPDMAAAYELAAALVGREGKRPKPAGIGPELRQRFGGKLPPSVQALCSGKVESPAGWNQVALQLGTLAQAIGLDEDDLLAACAGLICSHESDGRYSTARARERQLRDQFRYAGRSSYACTVGGLKSILPPGLNTRDLQGLGR